MTLLHQQQRFNLRWLLLLITMALILLASHTQTAVAQEEDTFDMDAAIDAELHAEEGASQPEPAVPTVETAVPEPEPEPVPEPEPEPAPVPAPVPEPEPEPVKPKEEPVKTKAAEESKKNLSSNPSSPAPSKAGPGIVKAFVTKGKALLDRAKSMSKKDMKKTAAVALGVWGLAAGVGWLASSNKPTPVKATK